MKSEAHRAEMARRAEKRAARAARAKSLAPRDHRSPKTTTDVSRTAAAKKRRDRRALRRINEQANGGWR